ncbi:hypothetical protein C8Q70DRAFT_202869 [Cubamyces menziesii]|nr:hypothetical protein C8Q70DRAFT_202869 [Cubamyces menziesii]
MDHSAPDSQSLLCPTRFAFGNIDTFRLILGHLQPIDVLQISCISKRVRVEALEERLSRTIHLQTYSQLSSLYDTTFSKHAKARIACVRKLILDFTGPASADDKEKLAPLLQGCEQLRYLEILGCDQLLLEHTGLHRIITSLTKLSDLLLAKTRLGYFEKGSVPAPMISLLAPTLRRLQLPRIESTSDASFLKRLATTQPGLESLSFAARSLSSQNTCFPLVVCLTVTLNHYPRPRDIYTLFPNARRITINCTLNFDITKPPIAAMEARRLAMEDCQNGNVWRSLDLYDS